MSRGDPSSFVPTTHRRPDFDDFWELARRELESAYPSTAIERSSLRSTPDVDAFEKSDGTFSPGLLGRMASGIGSDPYDEVKDHLRIQPHLEERVLALLDYIDTVNFADRIRVPTLLSVGLRDDVCPPRTAHGLYNRVTCPEEMRGYPSGAREGGFVHGEVELAWLNERLIPGRVIAS